MSPSCQNLDKHAGVLAAAQIQETEVTPPAAAGKVAVTRKKI